jgi:hypothetical protein
MVISLEVTVQEVSNSGSGWLFFGGQRDDSLRVAVLVPVLMLDLGLFLCVDYVHNRRLSS